MINLCPCSPGSMRQWSGGVSTLRSTGHKTRIAKNPGGWYTVGCTYPVHLGQRPVPHHRRTAVGTIENNDRMNANKRQFDLGCKTSTELKALTLICMTPTTAAAMTKLGTPRLYIPSQVPGPSARRDPHVASRDDGNRQRRRHAIHLQRYIGGRPPWCRPHRRLARPMHLDPQIQP